MPEIIPGQLRTALQQLLRSPTRALIFTELLLADESSASILAERLALDLNTVAYHVRGLARAGLIEMTREVTYRGGVSQKFYRATRSLRLCLQARPQAVAAMAGQAGAEERFDACLAQLLLAANVLARAPTYYGSEFDTQTLDSLFLHQPLGMVAFGGLSRPALAELAQHVRDLLDREWANEPQQPHRDLVVFAALPEFLRPEQRR